MNCEKSIMYLFWKFKLWDLCRRRWPRLVCRQINRATRNIGFSVKKKSALLQRFTKKHTIGARWLKEFPKYLKKIVYGPKNSSTAISNSFVLNSHILNTKQLKIKCKYYRQPKKWKLSFRNLEPNLYTHGANCIFWSWSNL